MQINYIGTNGTHYKFNLNNDLDKKITLSNLLEINEYALLNTDQYYTIDNVYQSLYTGSNDYRKYNIGENPYIPISSQWGGGVFGNGLYCTTNYDLASSYAIGVSTTLFNGGSGCSNNPIVRNIEYDKTKELIGRIMKEKKDYLIDDWNKLITNIDFIVNIYDGNEIVFLPSAKNSLKIINIFKLDSNICNNKYNEYIGNELDQRKALFPHACLNDNKIKCPTSCEYLKNNGTLKGNCHNGAYDEMYGGNNIYYNKYIKYKIKYHNLKKLIINHQ